MPVTGNKRRDFTAVVADDVIIPGGGVMRVGMTDNGDIKISIEGRFYQLQSMFRGGGRQKGVGGVNLIFTADKRRRS